MTNEPFTFYTSQIATHNLALAKLKNQLALSSILRLLVFLAIIAGVYIAFGNTKWVVGLLLAGSGLFVYLVSRHSNLQYRRNLLLAMIAQNGTELQVLDRNFHHLPAGDVYKNDLHFYSQDIDLFGRGSFYQYINRTALESGSDLLAALLTENSITDIPKKQEAIQELAAIPQWRQRFSAIASLVKTEVSAANVVKWLQNYQSFVPVWAKKASVVFSIISASFIVLYFFGFMSGYIVFGWFLLGVLISGRYFKNVNTLSEKTTKIQSTFEQFHKLISEIEATAFSSALLSEKKEHITAASQKASVALQQFAKHLDALDQRSNLLVGVVTNGFMLRDLHQSYLIEKWIQQHKEQVANWFEVITFFDGYNSLGNYAFNHPHAVFPQIIHSEQVLNVKGAVHPLLKQETAVKNDIFIQNEQFFIITGANMAGKSTFLRTVSLQIVMANVGLPTHAETAVYHPIKLITSMRTTDSLTDDESYFFSELKRLKFIVEEIKKDRYFIILDEILKGTNSTDKAIGSRKFIEKLVNSKATGIIATHDLSLCKAAEDLPQVKNYYFDARIENDELYFDYTFKPGICQNMNASFLLKKMEIID